MWIETLARLCEELWRYVRQLTMLGGERQLERPCQLPIDKVTRTNSTFSAYFGIEMQFWIVFLRRYPTLVHPPLP